MLIGIIGAGTMGTNHARVLSAMKDVDICISEVNEERCRDIAGTFNAKSHYFDHNEMLEKEKLDGVDAFTKALGAARKEEAGKYKVSKKDLPAEDMLLVVLSR